MSAGLCAARGRGPLRPPAPTIACLRTALLVAALLGHGVGQAAAAPSSYSRQASGTKVVYLFLQDLGYRVTRLLEPEELASTEADVLVVIGPADGEHGGAVLRWARKGKAVILAPPLLSAEGFCSAFSFGPLEIKRRHELFSKKQLVSTKGGKPTPKISSPEAKEGKPGPERSAAGAKPGKPAPPAISPTKTKAGRSTPNEKSAAGTKPGKPAPKKPVAGAKPDETSTIESRDGDLNLRPTACVLQSPKDAIVLAGTRDRALVYEHQVGQGTVLVLAHDDLTTNGRLDWDDLAVLLRRWLDKRAPVAGRIAFFEEAQGGQLLRLLRQSALGPFVAHAVIWLILLYWCLAPRFGDPRPAASSSRREFSQHARALGHLYQHRGASRWALARQYERFLARLGQPPRAGSAPLRRVGSGQGWSQRGELAAIVATKTGHDVEATRDLLRHVEESLAAGEMGGARQVQARFRLSRDLASLQRSARQRTAGPRGRPGRR